MFGDATACGGVNHRSVASALVLVVVHLLAASDGGSDSGAFLGKDLLPYLVLAMGGALVVGNVAAIVRPPAESARKEGDLDRAPVARSIVMAVVGLVAALWALASLLTG